MNIYVAGSSRELDECSTWMQRLRDAGHTVTLDWVANIRAVGDANPREAAESDRRKWTSDDFDGVDRARVIWLLVPGTDMPSIGCWVEFGYAWARRKIIVSGDWRKTIFTSLADKRFDSHQEAFDWIIGEKL